VGALRRLAHGDLHPGHGCRSLTASFSRLNCRLETVLTVRRRNRSCADSAPARVPDPCTGKSALLPGYLTSCGLFLAIPAVVRRNVGDPSRLVHPVSELSPSGNREEASENLQPPQTPPQNYPRRELLEYNCERSKRLRFEIRSQAESGADSPPPQACLHSFKSRSAPPTHSPVA
jgi:hypothetical protein